MDILNRELTQARQIQLQWLPDQPCSFQQIDLAAVNMPASHVSGDFYNWFELPDGRIVVMVGDVTGHGMAAAFLMATTQLLVRTTMPGLCNPGLCLEEVNRQLCIQVFNGQFVTMLVMVMDPENGEIALASAGHPPPFVWENDVITELAIDPQLVLGVDPETKYETQRFPLGVPVSRDWDVCRHVRERSAVSEHRLEKDSTALLLGQLLCLGFRGRDLGLRLPFRFRRFLLSLQIKPV
jgi:sigma-B regulation protein RsbU (phosphoserine phosphatase)